ERMHRQGQIDRLLELNREVTDANRQLTRFIDELRARNEELMLMTEEAQASTEEVETLNEELQASNEELETLNEELQATVEELNTTNDELQARSIEAQHMAQVSELGRARLEMILRSMADAVLVIDRTGQVELANEAARQLFGGPGREVGMLGNVALLDQDGLALVGAEMLQQFAAHGESFALEFTIRTPEGEFRFYDATGGPIRSGGEGEGEVVVVRDITDRSQRQMQDEFLALANHELRAPLTVLQSSIQMLIRQLSRRPEDVGALRARADTALTQAQQLGRLISDLASTTRLQSGRYQLEPAPLRLDDLVAQAVEGVRTSGEGPRIELVRGEPLTVNADAGRLEQVVLNLLQNALTYAAGSERIVVRLGQAEGWARIEVQDFGSGIPAAEIPRIFNRFYQVHRTDRAARGGLGLGLYISQGIARAHGGRIEVASVEGHGTTFTVLLPLGSPDEREDSA
ncbi:MAG TPA: ATP-binding protein, partial [Nitrolancea sp.]|nr:ATP-binding protein [Nitrolancea sp.]